MFICPKCKVKCKKNYCMHCGLIFDNESYSQIKLKPVENNDLENFVGKNYDKIFLKTRNYACGIFGSFYFLYRKCILLGFLFLILELLVLNFYDYFNFFVILVLLIIRFIFYSVIFNQYYIFKMKRKFQKLKDKSIVKSNVSIIYPVFGLLFSTIIFYIYFNYFQ